MASAPLPPDALPPVVTVEGWDDTPAGRPRGAPYRWWRLHDEYAS